MSLKSKGINAERELIHRFWNTNSWVAVRIAGSGSMKYPSPDILASNKLRKLAVECKVTKENKKYFEKKSIFALKKFAENFGAEPWIAIKFKGYDWYFISLEDMMETGNNFIVDINTAKSKGLLFEEMVGD